MKSIICTVILLSLLLLPETDLFAQPQLTGYVDLGTTNVSDDLYMKMAGSGSYRFGKNRVEAGFQLDLITYNSNVFSGLNLNAAREFRIKNFPFELRGFYILTPFSGLSRETNWGFLLDFQPEHFEIKAGTSFRTIASRKKAVDEYNADQNHKIRENWNIIYSFSYFLKRSDSEWNIGLSITNIDHYIINQETNPNFNLNGYYQINAPLKVFAEAWYKSAGAFNLSVNYFGFFFRTGIIWDIR
jgi:hypothetical protein